MDTDSEKAFMPEKERLDQSEELCKMMNQQWLSKVISGMDLQPIIENSEQSEMITYFSEPQYSMDELISAKMADKSSTFCVLELRPSERNSLVQPR